MGNLRKHAWHCWGDEILQGANACGDLDSAQQGVDKAKKLKVLISDLSTLSDSKWT